MTTQTTDQGTILQNTLVNYLISMARTVEATVGAALEALLELNPRRASQVFLAEPGINEMEILIDEHAVRLLRRPDLAEADVRLVVATIKVNNDLERMGDQAVNIAQRVVSLAQMPSAPAPEELVPMTAAVRAMMRKSLGALSAQNPDLAGEVLASDDVVDRYRDQIFDRLLGTIAVAPAQVPTGLQFVLAARHLERIADHATNIAEDVLFWLRGLEVRHGRGRALGLRSTAAQQAPVL